MLQTLKNAWKIVDLRKKILFTLFIIIIFRIGAAIPVPFTDPTALAGLINGQGSVFGFVDLMSGGAFSQATLFALSISPYITASIVIQLLTIAIPALENMQKEGEDGRKKLAKITRYTTVVLAFITATAYYFMLRNSNVNGKSAVTYTQGWEGIFVGAIIILSFTAGALLLMWLGEQVDNKGVGNGISMILFASIISRGPQVVTMLWQSLTLKPQNYFFVPLIVVLFLLLIAFIVVMTSAERRITVQYAKRMVGRKMYGGQTQHIPIKVNMSGVMPIIFASSILSLPLIIKGFAYPVPPEGTNLMYSFLSVFDYTSWTYAIINFLLIIAFNYFYVAVQYNPVEMANNLRKNNGTVPGIRPGKPTSDYIGRIISKVTLIGALFLGFIAVLPVGVNAITGIDVALGGTSIIIIVGVALDTSKQLESQMMMRHYKGFLE